MRILRSALVVAVCLGSIPVSNAAAETRLELDGDLGEAIRKLFDAMKPHLDEAFEMLEEFEGLGGIDDPRHYTLPEVLPNGDIIIRRREDAPPFQRPDPPHSVPEEESIDL